MTGLETLVRDALADEAGRAKADAETAALLLDGVERRSRAAAARRPVLIAASVALLLGATGLVATLVSGGHGPAPGPVGGISSPVATRITEPVALSTVAECRGLSVRVDGPDGAPDAGLITWLQPGSANRVTVDGNHLLYLRAVGQCTDRLAYMVVEPPHEDRAQGLSGDAEQPFRKAEGGIVTHADTPGQAEVRILLSCPLTASCASDPEVLATLTLDIVAPLGSGQTLSPSSALERTAPPESLHGAGGEPSTPPTAPG